MAKKGQTVKAKQGGGKKTSKTSDSAAEAVAAAAALTVNEVKRLEEELKESKTKLNNMLALIEAARGGTEEGAGKGAGAQACASDDDAWKVQMAALLALCRCCSRLMESRDLVPPGVVPKTEDKAKGINRAEIKASKDKLAVWMAGTYKEVTKVALDLVRGPHVKGQLVGMRAVMGLVAREAETAAELCCSPPVWTDGLFPALVTAMLTSPHTSQSLLKVSAPEMNAP